MSVHGCVRANGEGRVRVVRQQLLCDQALPCPRRRDNRLAGRPRAPAHTHIHVAPGHARPRRQRPARRIVGGCCCSGRTHRRFLAENGGAGGGPPWAHDRAARRQHVAPKSLRECVLQSVLPRHICMYLCICACMYVYICVGASVTGLGGRVGRTRNAALPRTTTPTP
jgi:hypothetical protein